MTESKNKINLLKKKVEIKNDLLIACIITYIHDSDILYQTIVIFYLN